MKITEDGINHNALRLIEAELGCLYDYSDQDENLDHTRLLTLGYINGVIAMANEMKEELKDDRTHN